MSGSTHNQSSSLLSLGKLGNLLFARQTPMRNAETHPAIFTEFARRFNAWRDRRAAAAELYGLSDRELADIGLTRLQIPEVVQRKN
jgi:uncharacterized protein YjiS (DUF1127 family)